MTEDLHCLHKSGSFTDVLLVAGSTLLFAHRFLVAAASSAFHKLLVMDFPESAINRRSSDSSMVSGTFGDPTIGNFNSDTECLISNDHSQNKPAA